MISEDSQYEISPVLSCLLCQQFFSETQKPIRVCNRDHSVCISCFVKHFQELISDIQRLEMKDDSQSSFNCLVEKCQSDILKDGFAVDYRILAVIKHHKSKPKSHNERPLFEQIGSAFGILMSFLTEKDKVLLVATSCYLRSLLMNGEFWGQFEVTDCRGINILSKSQELVQKVWTDRLRWYSKYFSVIKPLALRVVVMRNEHDQNLLRFFLRPYYFVRELVISCNNQVLHLALSKSCPNVRTVSASSPEFSDSIFLAMTQPGQMAHIKSLEVIKDDSSFSCENICEIFHQENTLQRLILKPHMVDFEAIAMLMEMHCQSMTELQLDVQDCEEETLLQIISSIPHVETLRLYHMENFHQSKKLAQSLSPSIRELCISKAYSLPLQLTIQKIATPKLLVVDFTELNCLTDEDVLLLANNCQNLKKVDICWCSQVSQKSIKAVVENSLNLERLNVTGQKSLNDEVFGEAYCKLMQKFDQGFYDAQRHKISQWRKNLKHKSKMQLEKEADSLDEKLEEEPNDSVEQYFSNNLSKAQLQELLGQVKLLRRAKQLTCISCNSISDKILKVIYIVNRKIDVVNYYSNSLGLWAMDEFDSSGDYNDDFY